MKCPNCAAEVRGNFCEYCGSEMPQEKSTVNIVNNYYGDTTIQENSENDTNTGKCPKCGNSKITFSRERIATTTQSQSRKNYIGNSRQRQSVSQSSYETVGICQNCGYTWNPYKTAKVSKRKTWLWVIGWIFMFPIPLTILLLRKKDMKPAVKYGIIALAWVLFFAAGMIGSSNADTSQSDTPPSYIENTKENNSTNSATETITKETTEEETTSVVEQIKNYYDRNETINLFLNRFNAINPEQIIDSNLYRVYYHHGKEHDDQIIFTRDDIEVVITAYGFDNGIKLVITGSRDKTFSDYKTLFFQYAKAYSADLTDEKLETYWQAILDDIINNPEFEEFDCSLNIYNESVESMVIEGKLQ